MFVATIEFLLAATFVVIPVAALRFGVAAQDAAETYARRHGVSAPHLLESGFKIKESRTEALLPLTLAVVFAILAVLNLMSTGAGRSGALIVHALFFFVGGFITGSQVFVVQYVGWAFARSPDASLHHLDARELVTAANAAFPSWLRPLVVIRFGLATAGSAAIVAVLLATR